MAYPFMREFTGVPLVVPPQEQAAILLDYTRLARDVQGRYPDRLVPVFDDMHADRTLGLYLLDNQDGELVSIEREGPASDWPERACIYVAKVATGAAVESYVYESEYPCTPVIAGRVMRLDTPDEDLRRRLDLRFMQNVAEAAGHEVLRGAEVAMHQLEALYYDQVDRAEVLGLRMHILGKTARGAYMPITGDQARRIMENN